MADGRQITLLGAGLIGTFYAMTIHVKRSRDRIRTVCAKTEEEARAFAQKWGVPSSTGDMDRAVNDPATDLVIVGLPNDLHKQACLLAARAGKSVLCTKPLARTVA